MSNSPDVTVAIPRGMPHLTARFVNTPLMVDPAKFDVIVRAIGPRMGIDPTALPDLEERSAALAAHYSDAGDDRDYSVLDGIAVIPVQGTLMKKDSWMSSWSGCCSYLRIQQQMQGALSDAGVRGILLDIDSPGGEVSGCFELCDFIFGARGQKPIYAAANDCALSAAYAIASAADRIFVTRAGAVGSIGVYALHADESGWDKQLGVKYTYVFAGAKKVDGNPHESLSKSAYTDLKTEIDREYGIFTQTVSRNRKADRDAIVSTEAGLLWADNSIPLLADAVGAFDDAMNALLSASKGTKSFSAAAAAIPIKGEPPMPNNKAKAAEEEMDEQCGKASDAEPDPDDPNEKEEIEEGEKEKEMPETNEKKAAEAAPLAGVAAAVVPSRSIADIKAISALCKLAGCPEMAAGYLESNKSIAEVSEVLTAGRVEESQKTAITSRVDTNRGAAARIQDIETEAGNYARQNKGMTKEQAFAQMLEANPEAYAAFRSQHNAKALLSTLEAAGVAVSFRQ